MVNRELAIKVLEELLQDLHDPRVKDDKQDEQPLDAEDLKDGGADEAAEGEAPLAKKGGLAIELAIPGHEEDDAVSQYKKLKGRM